MKYCLLPANILFLMWKMKSLHIKNGRIDQTIWFLCAQYLMALHRRTCLCSVLNHTIFEWLFNSIFPPVICYFNSRSATWIGYYIFFLYTWCFVDFSLKLCWCDQYLILISLLSECDVYKHLLISIFCELWPRHHEHCEITEYNF